MECRDLWTLVATYQTIAGLGSMEDLLSPSVVSVENQVAEVRQEEGRCLKVMKMLPGDDRGEVVFEIESFQEALWGLGNSNAKRG